MTKAIFQVEDVFQIPGKGVFVIGVVKMGAVKKGLIADIKGIKTEISEILVEDKDVNEVKAEEKCALLLKGVSKDDLRGVTMVYFE